MFDEKKYEFEIEGQKCYFSSGVMARVSETAVLARMGDTVIIATVNTGDAQSDAEYFPMSVEYIEQMYASGKIPGSRFVKRERFPTEDAILRARMIDRSMRPMFASDYRNELQVIVKVLSAYFPVHRPKPGKRVVKYANSKIHFPFFIKGFYRFYDLIFTDTDRSFVR